MFSLFKQIKNAEPAFAKWMKESAKKPWKWAALEVNSESLGVRRLSIKHEDSVFGLELLPDLKLTLQVENKNLFCAKAPKTQAESFANATQDTFLTWMSQTPRSELDKRIENLNEDLLPQEDRALMWLQTSFQVIDQALNECVDPKADTVLQAKIFAGKPTHLKDSESFEWRIILFEVDFQVIFRKDGRLEVKVFRPQNDPKKRTDAGPDLHAVFALRRREVYDLFVQQINLIGRACLR